MHVLLMSFLSDWTGLLLEGDRMEEHKKPPPGDNSYSNMLQMGQVSLMDEDMSDT